MTFPAIENLTSAKLMLFMGQLPDWHLDAVTTHTVRALRSRAAGEILAVMPSPALPRPPAPPPNPTRAIVMWGTYFESRVMRKLAEAIDAEFVAIFANQLTPTKAEP